MVQKMKKEDRLVVIFVLSLPVVFVCLYFLWNVFFGLDEQQFFLKESKDLTFNGRVDSIYNDRSNHNIVTLILRNGYRYEVYDDWVKFFEKGDSVFKEKDSLKLFIYKKNKEPIVLNYNELKKIYKK